MPEDAAFDHLVHWVDDLDRVTEEYRRCGLPAVPVLTMPGFRNAAWPVDAERYVELAAVDDWRAVTESKYATAIDVLKPAIDALVGPGLLTFAVDVDDARATAARMRAAGRDVEVVEVHFEDLDVGFVEVFVRDAPAHFPFFITYSPPRAELARMRAEALEAAGTPVGPGPELVALVIGSADPHGESRLLAEFVGCAVRDTTVELPGAQVRFVESESPGLCGIVARGIPEPEQATIAGMTVTVEELG
ncbi:hypothetical protein GCM10027289_12660 [Tsukamurella serpentis]